MQVLDSAKWCYSILSCKSRDLELYSPIMTTGAFFIYKSLVIVGARRDVKRYLHLHQTTTGEYELD